MTDEAIKQLLEEWNLPQLIPTFEEHEMDVSCLIDISDDSIKELIPKIGPRTIFLRYLTTYRMENSNTSTLTVDNNLQIPCSDIKVESEIVLHSETFSNSSELTNVDISLSNEENKYNDATLVNVVSPISPEAAASSELLREVAEDSSTLINNSPETKSAKKRAAPSSGFQAPDGNEETRRFCRSSHNLNLRELLSLSGTGKYILRNFEVQNRLCNKDRNILVNIIVNAMLCESEYLDTADFEIIVEKICAAFPGEASGTYYVSQSSTNPGKPTKYGSQKGKLVDKYRNLRALFQSTSVDVKEDQDQQNVANETVIAELRNCADCVKYWSQPSDAEILENWKNSYELRRLNIKNSLQHFFYDWPIVLHNRFALKLINFDFQKLFPNCHLLQFIVDWEQLFNKMKHMKYGNGKDSGDCDEFIASIKESTSEDSKHAIQFASFPIFFSHNKVIKINEILLTPSMIECQPSLIILVKIHSAIENFIKDRKLIHQKLGLSIQPYLIVVGPDWCSITDFYLVIDHRTIKCDSVLGAIDLLFKIFHVSGTLYPVESEHIWLLIQKWIYNINTKWDKNIPMVSSLLQDLRTN